MSEGFPETVVQARQRVSELLRQAGIDTPELDSRLLLQRVTGLAHAQLYLSGQQPLTASQRQQLDGLLARRLRREPMAYILGQRAFYDLELEVTPDVLVPRPETEALVEAAIAWGGQFARRAWAVDVGTGSGAIALALARHLSATMVAGLDISLDALRVAKRNAQRVDVTERVMLLNSDLLAALREPFALVCANLPYLPTAILTQRQPEVRDYEPRLALDGGTDGLVLIRRLCEMLPTRLAKRALVLLEIDQGQGETVSALLSAVRPGAQIRVLRDYAGYERVVRAEWL
ncbi:MAG: peptide chain release factor N(5)-glutamine methyltransferase [Chloroflexi bacterium]|nr:peptide chain release factor N(5)-glutamine methyltransferase [Chloroflexota bacterium]